MPPRRRTAPAPRPADTYKHPESESLMRPEVGTVAGHWSIQGEVTRHSSLIARLEAMHEAGLYGGDAAQTDAPSRDRTLMERIHAGDRSALDELIGEHWVPLVAYAERLLQSRDDAEDIVQEAMLRLWHGRDGWTPTDRLRSFLYRITRNLAMNERRRLRIRDRHSEEAARGAEPRIDSPIQLVERREIRDAMARALETVAPRRREVFVLGWYHGHSYREIAEIMNISPQTVANQMSAALDDLRQLLRPQVDALLSRGRLHLVRDGPAMPPA